MDLFNGNAESKEMTYDVCGNVAKGQSGASRLKRRYEWVAWMCPVCRRVSCISSDRLCRFEVDQSVRRFFGNSEEIVFLGKPTDSLK